MILTKEKNTFCYIGSQSGQRGVGFLIKNNISHKLTEFRGISDRIAIIKFQFEKQSLTIIQIYAPTATTEEKTCDEFYSQLKEILNKQKQNIKNHLLILGDFNSQIGLQKTDEQETVGKFNYGKRNPRGAKLVLFCQENNFKLVNTFFKKREGKRWTWLAPNQTFKSQIDYILAPPPITFNNITNCDTLAHFQFHSDHRPIFCKLAIKNKRYRPNTQKLPPRISTETQEDYQLTLDRNLPEVGSCGELPSWEQIQKTILEAANLRLPPTEGKSE